VSTASNARISTERLELIPLEPAHAEDLFSILSDATLYEYTGDAPPASVVELRVRYAQLEARRSPDGTELWLNWVLSETATGMSVGWVQATVTAQHADVAWVVGTLWQRRGYATEAARALIIWLQCTGVTVVRAKIHPLHTASQRVAANVGLACTPDTVDGENVWVGRL
jgi:RimJ/RimL family protein N-acetyltransferase